MDIFEDSGEDGYVIGGDVDKVTASVVISGDALDPDEITRVLGIEPFFAARKGEQRRSRSGTRTISQRTGVWWVQVADTRERVLGDAIDGLLARLPADLEVWASLAEKYTLRLSCGLHLEDWNRGCELPPEVLKKIVDRRLTLDFDIYYSGDDA
jgi:uncharacterized protein DUF4279